MIPSAFPHDPRRALRRRAEGMVYGALNEALGDDWHVFYDCPISGSRRRIDFVAACLNRGLIAWEVKGGMVHDRGGRFRQLIRMPGHRKVIDPFQQLRWSVEALFDAAGISMDVIPLHQAIWFPEMGQAGLRWRASDHIWTRDLLDAEAIKMRVESLMPPRDDAVLSSLIARLVSGFARR